MACRKPRVLRIAKEILMFMLGQKYSRVADGTEPMKMVHPIIPFLLKKIKLNDT